MKFDMRSIHMADFVMDDNVVIKNRTSAKNAENFKEDLKKLCLEYGISNADHISMMVSRQVPNTKEKSANGGQI